MSDVVIAGDTSGSITLRSPAVSGSSVLTLPVATDTLVGKATTDTLTNKTLTSPTITGVTTVAAGSAAAPSIVSTTGTADTGEFFPAADTIAWSTAGSERVRITSTGLVGIGTAAPTSSLVVSGAVEGSPSIVGVHLGVAGSYACIELAAATGSLIDFTQTGTDTKGRILYDNASNYLAFNTNGAERMRISSTGDVTIASPGTSSTSAVTLSATQTLTNKSIAVTQLTGTLPVANGGTGLTTVPHTVQVFTSGSGTYTLPANCKAIKVTMVGGGGGGYGANGTVTGGGGGNTTFGGNTCNGGGAATGIYFRGGGGAVTVAAGTTAMINRAGGAGGGGGININGNSMGGSGGDTILGSTTNPGYVEAGFAGVSNTGAGGSGSSGGNGATLVGGGGGGGGGSLVGLISSPASTYSYGVGAGGAGGPVGINTSNAGAGGAGGSGIVLVEEFYV